MVHDPTQLPSDLPAPADDGGSVHLVGTALPSIQLPSTAGHDVDLASIAGASGCVIFCYPRTGVPGQRPKAGPSGEIWESVPGARGCTPQACGFRDLNASFSELDVPVFGLSTNTPGHQREFVERMDVRYELLSDADLRVTRALSLPTFEWPVESGGPTTLLKRAAWYVRRDASGAARIARVWYPVFPPDRNAQDVLNWVRRRVSVIVRAGTAADRSFVESQLARDFGGTQIWSLGRAYALDRVGVLIAEVDGRASGVATYDINPGGYQCELVALSASTDDAGVGTALLEGIEDVARRAACERVFLTTTNDNVRALAFYQKRGWHLVALHRGSVNEARKREPSIPLVGRSGIRVSDEIELERWL